MAENKVSEIKSRKKQRPAATPEARENQLISMAYDLAEDRLRNKTATGQEIVYLMKAGSEKARAEMEKLRKENELLVAKAEALQSAKHVEELYADALKAMRSYSGQETEDE